MFVDPRRGYDQPISRLLQSALSYVAVGFAAYSFVLSKRSQSSVGASVKHKSIYTLCFSILSAVWAVCTYVVYLEPLRKVYGRPIVISFIDLSFVVIWMYDAIALSGRGGLCDLTNEIDLDEDKSTKACHIQHAAYAVGIALIVLYAWTWSRHVFKGMIPIVREQGIMSLIRPQMYLVGAMSWDDHITRETLHHQGKNAPYIPRKPIVMTDVDSV
ncbi:hypothetical protein DIURU_002898 [Diutina rugosa]|uniref:Uncharacterized protein n=1 Tax=Diutina rugosa TaxID=5481 RepID=A0A642UNI1_DIURU|nr:uncharacterized protein DIURU_002898 [Diutina rugosa]KAA8902444.1 hypothetical protein DIURU_002898 [Diutina rugosa]